MIRLGIDIGGTFTDFALWDGSSEGYTGLRSFKLPSTPPRFADAVKDGIEKLLRDGDLSESTEIVIVHGTTVSTNAVIERSGPRLALLITSGFRDVLHLQRLRLENPHDLFCERPTSLIPRELVFPIPERLGPDGTLLTPLDCSAVVVAAKQAIAAGVGAIVICFLHSYAHPHHEIMARDAIRAAGIELDIVLSHEVWPQQGEYERAVAAVLNSYVKSTTGAYIAELEAFLSERLPRARLLITRSNGGVMAAAESRQFPVHTLLSGPAAGVTAAQFLGDLVGADRILTMDMGGTSTDLALIWRGRASVTTQAMVGDFPLMMPVTGIEAMGAGGGAIAHIDGTVLAVGPRSAGAQPGPACYGKGGTQPTLSDAYLLCGLLDPDLFLGGTMRLHRDLAEAAMTGIATFLGRDVEDAAEACIAVATSNMVASVLPYLARVGVDPQDLSLLVYGGAGAIHGPLLADELGIDRLIVPRNPSVFCALGGIVSDLVHDVAKSVRGRNLQAGELRESYARLADEARAWLAQQVAPELLVDTVIEHFAEMRYRGQFFVVDVPLSRPAVKAKDLAEAEEAFHAEHLRIYNHRSAAPVEFVALRLRIAGRLPRPAANQSAKDGLIARRTIRMRGRIHPATPVLDRASLSPGECISGPAIIEQSDATILVPAGFRAEVASYGDLMLARVN